MYLENVLTKDIIQVKKINGKDTKIIPNAQQLTAFASTALKITKEKTQTTLMSVASDTALQITCKNTTIDCTLDSNCVDILREAGLGKGNEHVEITFLETLSKVDDKKISNPDDKTAITELLGKPRRLTKLNFNFDEQKLLEQEAILPLSEEDAKFKPIEELMDGDFEAAKDLINQVKSLNYESDDFTPLTAPLFGSDDKIPENVQEIVDLLIKKGADPNTQDGMNNTPFDLALSNYKNVLPTLIPHIEIIKEQLQDMLANAARNSFNTTTVPALLERDDANNYVGINKNNPLITATGAANLANVEAMMNLKKIDLQKKDGYNNNILHVTVKTYTGCRPGVKDNALEIIKVVANKEPSLLHQKGDNSETPIGLAQHIAQENEDVSNTKSSNGRNQFRR